MADFAMVTSLHDGMNLVAKEFVASQVEQRGVLICSEFAGAAEALDAALLINPYTIRRAWQIPSNTPSRCPPRKRLIP